MNLKTIASAAAFALSLAHGAALADPSDVNPLTADTLGLTIGHSTSAVEEVAKAVPGAEVVKAFNTVFAPVQAEGADLGNGRKVSVFVASDSERAKQTATAIAQSIGIIFVAHGARRAEAVRRLRGYGLEGTGQFMANNGYEFGLALLAASVALLISGAGTASSRCDDHQPSSTRGRGSGLAVFLRPRREPGRPAVARRPRIGPNAHDAWRYERSDACAIGRDCAASRPAAAVAGWRYRGAIAVARCCRLSLMRQLSSSKQCATTMRTLDDVEVRRPTQAKSYLGLINAQPGRPLAMFAPRRVGKTYFLDHDLAPAARQAKWLPVNADLWLQKSAPLEAINHALEEALDDAAVPSSKVGRLAKTTVKKLGALGASVDFGDAPARRPLPSTPELRLDALVVRLAATADKPVLLMLDEIRALGDVVTAKRSSPPCARYCTSAATSGKAASSTLACGVSRGLTEQIISHGSDKRCRSRQSSSRLWRCMSERPRESSSISRVRPKANVIAPLCTRDTSCRTAVETEFLPGDHHAPPSLPPSN